MSIRVNPNLAPDLLSYINADRQAQNTALQQISSGQSVNQLSDDPSAAAEVVLNHAQTAQNAQFLQNISTVQSQAQTADSALNSVVTALTQAISLGVEGANGTLNDSDRQAVAAQVSGITSQVLALANQTYQGTYVFAGTATTTQPFVANAAQPDGVQYNGNTGVNSVQISSASTIPTNVPGSQIFTNAAGDVFGALNGLATALQTNTGIPAAATAVQTAFNELSTQRVFYGNTLQQVQSTQTSLNSDQEQLSSQENTLVGADLATSITNMQEASTATNAILTATGQILSSLNLLNYLK